MFTRYFVEGPPFGIILIFFKIMVRLWLYVLRRKVTEIKAIITLYQGHLPWTWLIILDVDCTTCLMIVFIMFLYFLSISILCILEGSWMYPLLRAARISPEFQFYFNFIVALLCTVSYIGMHECKTCVHTQMNLCVWPFLYTRSSSGTTDWKHMFEREIFLKYRYIPKWNSEMKQAASSWFDRL